MALNDVPPFSERINVVRNVCMTALKHATYSFFGRVTSYILD